MATQTLKHITVVRTDDVDGSEGAAQHTFWVDGEEYTIDLAEQNAEALQTTLVNFKNMMQTFIDYATPVKAVKRTPRTDARVIREWAAEQGFELNGKGRIPLVVLEAYNNAQLDAGMDTL